MSDAPTPIVVDLGKVKRKSIKELKRGTGPLLDELQQVVASTRESLGPDAAGKELVPLIVLYRPKRRRSKNIFGL